MPTDAEASKYSFLDHLEHYMERALITEDNRKAVELAIMVEAGTTVREMDSADEASSHHQTLEGEISCGNWH